MMNEHASTQSYRPAGDGQMQNLVREFTFVFFDRLRLIRMVFLTVFLLCVAAALLLPSAYRATAKFSLSIPQSLDPLQQETSYDYRNRTTRFLRDQKELILSNRVLEPVAEQFFKGSTKDMSAAIEAIRRRLVVTPPKGETYEGSTIFHVSYEHRSAQRSAEITEAIARSYLAAYADVARERSDYSYEFFTGQTDTIRQEMISRENTLRDYETRQAGALIEILNLGTTTDSKEVGISALLNQTSQKYHSLQEELAGVRATITAVEGELHGSAIPVVLPEMEVYGRSISMLKNKVAQLQMELNEMKPRFTADYELVQQLQKTLDLNVALLREEMQRSLRALKINAAAIEAQMQELENIMAQLNLNLTTTAGERAVYENLRQEYAIARDAYVNSRAQLEQARLSLSLNQGRQNITLVDRPFPPSAPYRPNRLLIIVLGFIAAVFLAIATALTVDHFDHTIKKPEDIERYLGASFLGSMPRITGDSRLQ
jgi:polysaccharide biosynthesis transport protein